MNMNECCQNLHQQEREHCDQLNVYATSRLFAMRRDKPQDPKSTFPILWSYNLASRFRRTEPNAHFDFNSVAFLYHFDVTSNPFLCHFNAASRAVRRYFDLMSNSCRFRFDSISILLGCPTLEQDRARANEQAKPNDFLDSPPTLAMSSQGNHF